ncbi:metallopeptidase family protein [Paenibacillus xerothermodurans]|uniref:metallopeptidase family protein n=1 Tax=Paenibacillus xerothermodurans TaxID=1977292 RepID=UPI001FB36030|nr:metallopeptidase family protein [Paenibacillus xerothermodurans]
MNAVLPLSGSQVEVSVQRRFPGKRLVGGKYQPASHKVTLYQEPIKQQCRQLFGSLDRLEDYIAVVFAHELGHAEDPQLEQLSRLLDGDLMVKERNAIALQIEENAWAFAEAWLTGIDPAFIRLIIDESLAAYRLAVQSDIA